MFSILCPPNKRNKSSSEKDGLGLKVDTGGTVQDHILWFAVDDDGDGITEVSIPGSSAIKVRAPACVWGAGADGRLGKYGQRDKASADDVYRYGYTFMGWSTTGHDGTPVTDADTTTAGTQFVMPAARSSMAWG